MVFLSVLRFPRNSVFIFFTAFNMVSEQGTDENLDTNIDRTHKENNHESVVAVVMEKLLHRLQKPPMISMGLPSESVALPSGGNQPHAPHLSAHAPPSVTSVVQPAYSQSLSFVKIVYYGISGWAIQIFNI